MHDIALVPLLFAAALGLGTTSSAMLGAAIGLYCPPKRYAVRSNPTRDTTFFNDLASRKISETGAG
jgi:hypothetical protein